MLTLTVTRQGGSAEATNVDYSLRRAPALQRHRYGLHRSVAPAFRAGESQKTFNVPIILTHTFRSSRTILVTLMNPTNGFTSSAVQQLRW